MGTPETLLHRVSLNHQSLFRPSLQIPVIHHRVVPMLNVEMVFARAYQNIKEILTEGADQSVFSAQIVIEQKLVYGTNVMIHAPEHVGKELAVMYTIMFLFARALKEQQETLFFLVDLYHHHQSRNLATHHHADRMHSAVLSMDRPYVHVFRDISVVHLLVDQNAS